MLSEQIVEITNIDAAEAHIKTAIRLFFDNDSPIAVYTLAAPALEGRREFEPFYTASPRTMVQT